MNPSRLTAAGGALALHGLALTAVLSLAVAPPKPRPVEPVRVMLLAPPQPLPVAPAPLARPEPTAAPSPPKRPVRAPPQPAPPKPPVPTEAPPAQAPSPISTPLPAASEPTSEPAPAPTEQPPVAASSRSARTGAPAAATTPTRSAPRIDANWSGNVPPPYPGLARRLGDQGEVRLDVHVGADGRVTEVRLRQSSGSTLLDRTAIETVKQWRFKPATVDGQPVAEWYHDWRWVFRLEG